MASIESRGIQDLINRVGVGEDEGGDPRCPVVLVLDTSYSMQGSPINELNNGLATFEREIKDDPLAKRRCEIAIVTFGGNVEVVQDFTLAGEFKAPSLKEDGGTPMGEAITRAIAMIEERKSWYKSQGIKYYRPWILMITDGEPNQDDCWQEAARSVREGDSPTVKKFMFFTVAVRGANMKILGLIAPPHRQPAMLDGLAFSSLFEWLSASLSSVSGSTPGDMVALAPMDGWLATS